MYYLQDAVLLNFTQFRNKYITQHIHRTCIIFYNRELRYGKEAKSIKEVGYIKHQDMY